MADAAATKAMFARLASVARRIRSTNDRLATLRDERRVIYREMLDAGVPRAHVAKAAGVTSMAVAFDVEGKGTPEAPGV